MPMRTEPSRRTTSTGRSEREYGNGSSVTLRSHAVDDRDGADPEGGCEDGDEREAGRPQQRADAVDDVTEEILEPHERARLARQVLRHAGPSWFIEHTLLTKPAVQPEPVIVRLTPGCQAPGPGCAKESSAAWLAEPKLTLRRRSGVSEGCEKTLACQPESLEASGKSAYALLRDDSGGQPSREMRAKAGSATIWGRRARKL
jgi:hypothetical protein